MQRFVLDTNVLINRQRDIGLGNSKEEVVSAFVKKYTTLTEKPELYATPESMTEFTSFFEDATTSLRDFMTIITIQSPSLTTLSLDASLFAEIIAETGKRLYRGMRVTEECVRAVIADKNTDTQQLHETYVAQLRKKYRIATREGFIDSTIDLGLILLAKEQNAVLVTSDSGLLVWARKFGAKECLPEVFVQKIFG